MFNSVTQLCPTLCDPMNCSTPGLPVHHQLLEPTQTHVHWVSDAIQPSHPSLSPSPPALSLSQHQGLFSESALLIRWPKYWSFSFNISPSQEHLGLISFRKDWLDLLAVQGLFESSPTPQFKSINSSVLSFLYNPALTSMHDYWKNWVLGCYLTYWSFLFGFSLISRFSSLWLMLLWRLWRKTASVIRLRLSISIPPRWR